MQKNLLRSIPKTDELLQSQKINDFKKEFGEGINKLVLKFAKQVLSELREGILSGDITSFDDDFIFKQIRKKLDDFFNLGVRKVINATGIVLHTNLGRAAIDKNLAKKAIDTACGYCNLEYDLDKGERGSRHDHAQKLLCDLCEQEDAMVVNNNAAAIMLALSAVCKGQEVIVSRGELVEIGGSFRVPEIMSLSGNFLKEVGTTNKTHIKDYEDAINENTGALLKVHTSNFKILGFTKSVELYDLCKIGEKHNLPVIYDLGGGALVDLCRFGIADEPHIGQILKSNVDLLTFSGDKLLGGPQAGIIVGKKKYIQALKKHPLARAVRVDKITLSLLCESLKCYFLDNINIPTINMLETNFSTLYNKANRLKSLLIDVKSEIVEDFGQVGGGSVPTEMIKSVAVKINDKKLSVNELEKKLRQHHIPVIARIANDALMLDLKTINDDEIQDVANAINQAFKKGEK